VAEKPVGGPYTVTLKIVESGGGNVDALQEKIPPAPPPDGYGSVTVYELGPPHVRLAYARNSAAAHVREALPVLD
jgi:hypothetical protein